jgi:hypothetical protein
MVGQFVMSITSLTGLGDGHVSDMIVKVSPAECSSTEDGRFSVDGDFASLPVKTDFGTTTKEVRLEIDVSVTYTEESSELEAPSESATEPNEYEWNIAEPAPPITGTEDETAPVTEPSSAPQDGAEEESPAEDAASKTNIRVEHYFFYLDGQHVPKDNTLTTQLERVAQGGKVLDRLSNSRLGLRVGFDVVETALQARAAELNAVEEELRALATSLKSGGEPAARRSPAAKRVGGTAKRPASSAPVPIPSVPYTDYIKNTFNSSLALAETYKPYLLFGAASIVIYVYGDAASA